MDKRDNLYIDYPINNVLQKIIKKLLMDKDFSQAFQILPAKSMKHYYRTIANPISLRAIRIGLAARRYKTLHDVYEDFMLIGKNCRYYNEDGSVISDYSIRLDKEIKRLFKRYDLDIQLEKEQKGGSKFEKEVREMDRDVKNRKKMATMSIKTAEPSRQSERILSQRGDSEEEYHHRRPKTLAGKNVKVKELPKSAKNKQLRTQILNEGRAILDLMKYAHKAKKEGKIEEFMETVEDTASHLDTVQRVEKNGGGINYVIVLSNLKNREMRKVVDKFTREAGISDSSVDL